MKIVVVHNTYQQPGGEDVAVAAERDLLESHGRTVIRYSRINDEIATTSGTRRLLMVKDIIHSGRSQREMLDLLRSERPDLVHVHNTFMMVSPSVFEACREAGIPAVQTLNNYKLLCPGWSLCREGKVCEECLESGLWRAYGTLAIAMRTGRAAIRQPPAHPTIELLHHGGRARRLVLSLPETEPAYRSTLFYSKPRRPAATPS